jgi:tetratricopeptide (TPR) repeat protein
LKHFRNSWLTIVLLTLIGVAMIATDSRAFGSSSKSPEEKAADSVKVAIETYNVGVKHMDKGKAYDSQADSLFAFNYRATKAAKAENEYRKAAEDFEKAAALQPTMVEALNNLGFCRRKLNLLPESLSAYDAALAIDSLYAPAREYRGELFLAMGDLVRARAELDVLKRLNPGYADTLSRSIDFFLLRKFEDQMKKNP